MRFDRPRCNFTRGPWLKALLQPGALHRAARLQHC